MGIFNEISQTVSRCPIAQADTKGTNVDKGGYKIVGFLPGAGDNQVHTINQITDTFFDANTQKYLIMNKKYIRGLKTDFDDPTLQDTRNPCSRK